MPKISFVQTNFTAGELSPKLNGRTDIDRYANGAAKLENIITLIQGGALRAPGTQYCATTKYSDKKSRLIPYVFNRQQAYIIEFGDKYLRFYNQDGSPILSGSNPYEITSPYSVDYIDELEYVQGADTMFIANQNFPMYRLQRWNTTDWRLEPVPFVTEPYSDEAREQIDAYAVIGRDQDGGNDDEIIDGEMVWTRLASNEDGDAYAGAGFVSNDVGGYIVANDGLIKITTVQDSNHAQGQVITTLTSYKIIPPGAWTLEKNIWGGDYGYPAAVTLCEQRLVAAGTKHNPQTFWLSRTGEYLDFTQGQQDSDGMEFTIDSAQLNPIIHLAYVNTLLALTYGGEFTISGGAEKAITPTNISVKNPGAYGCTGVKPVRIGSELLFVQRAGKKIRAASYDPNSYQAFTAPDVTVLADHITGPGISDIAYQQEPYSLMWCVRNDGVLAVCTIDREQDVIGWTRRVTSGEFESVACVPAGDQDALFVVVKRTINNKTVRYLEKLDFNLNTDSTYSASNSEGLTNWTGINHLENTLVDIVADGAVMPVQRVTNGQITLPRKAYSIQIGLHYESQVKTLTPEFQTGEGSAQGTFMRANEISLKFLETTGCEIDGKIIAFRDFGPAILDKPPPLFTGTHRTEYAGWGRGDYSLSIEQKQPLPFHLLSVTMKFTSNGG